MSVKQPNHRLSLNGRECTFGQHISQMFSGAHASNGSRTVKVDSLKLQVQVDTVGAGHVCQFGTAAMNDNTNDCFAALKNEQPGWAGILWNVTLNVVNHLKWHVTNGMRPTVATWALRVSP